MPLTWELAKTSVLIKHLTVILILAGLVPLRTEAGDIPFSHGIMDLRAEQLKNDMLPLNGFWEFYPNQLLAPDSVNASIKYSYVEVPSWWVESNRDMSVQYGTYRLRIVLSEDDRNRPLALDMPDVYCSYVLWIDGERVGENGLTGPTKETSRPQWRPQTYAFEPESDTVELVIQIANFYHYRTGMRKPIYLGDAGLLVPQQRMTLVSNTILFVGLICFALGALVVFAMVRNLAIVFYSLLCLTWAMRSIFSNYYLSVQWFPDLDWYLCVRIEYITLYLSTLFGTLLVGTLFPRELNEMVKRFFIYASLCFTLFTLIVSPLVFTHFVQLYLGLSSALLIYLVIIIVRAYIESRQGASYLLICLMLGVLMFAYVILAYEDVFELNELFFNIGFLTLFLLTAGAMTVRIFRMSTTYDYDSLTFEEVSKPREFLDFDSGSKKRNIRK